MTYLRPDAKSQVTIEYSDDNKATAHRRHCDLYTT